MGQMKQYYEFHSLEHVYLEDSYVLDIQTEPDSVEISVETVLTANHPQYSDPLPNEQYCYRNGRICFQNAKRITWVKKSMILMPDLVGPPDYGNIDVFYFSEGSYHLIGDWGELEIVSSEPLFELVE